MFVIKTILIQLVLISCFKKS